MDREEKDTSYEEEEEEAEATGSSTEEQEYKIREYPFGKYQIKLKLSLTNEFIDILEVKINKGFLSYKQKATTKGYHDVDEFYPE